MEAEHSLSGARALCSLPVPLTALQVGKNLVMGIDTVDHSVLRNTLLLGGCLTFLPVFVFACREHHSLVSICYIFLHKQELSEVELVYSHKEAAE